MTDFRLENLWYSLKVEEDMTHFVCFNESAIVISNFCLLLNCCLKLFKFYPRQKIFHHQALEEFFEFV